MKREVIYDTDLHFEHQRWQSELYFWKDELKSFNNRLSELITRWTKKEVLAQLEHFQNEFILHGGVIDNLLESIEIHESGIARQNLAGQQALDTVMLKNHMEIRRQMEAQRQIYADLKKEFFAFLSKYM